MCDIIKVMKAPTEIPAPVENPLSSQPIQKKTFPIIFVFASLFIIIICLILILIIINWKFLKLNLIKDSNNKNEALQINPSCKYNDQAVCLFLSSWEKVTDVTISSTLTAATGEKSTSLVEIQGQGNSHIVNYNNAGQEVSNWIILGDNLYSKDYSDGIWWKQALTEEDKQLLDAQNISDFSNSEANNFNYIQSGTEPCGTLTCYVYQVIDPSNSDITRYIIYIDTQDYRQQKERVENQDGSITESSFQYEPVNITEPTPTKLASADQNILLSPGSPLYEEAIQKATDEMLKQLLENLNGNQNP